MRREEGSRSPHTTGAVIWRFRLDQIWMSAKVDAITESWLCGRHAALCQITLEKLSNCKSDKLAYVYIIITTIQLVHPFNGLFSRITWLSQYQKGKTSLHLNEARWRGLGMQWLQLDHMQTICT